MFKTLKISNGSFAQLGDPETQSGVVQDSKNHTSALKSGILPASQQDLKQYVINSSTDESRLHANSSLQSIAQALSNDASFLVPPMQSKNSFIMPSYALHLDPSKMFDSSAISSLISLPIKRLEPYEQLTGISTQRPELVMLLNFLPLFEKDTHAASHQVQRQEQNAEQFLTDAGKYIDLQCNVRKIRYTNMSSMISSLRFRFPALNADLNTKKSEFQTSIDKLDGYVTFLMNLVRNMHKIRRQLDLRDEIHTVDAQLASSNFVAQFTRSRVTASSQMIHSLTKIFIPDTYSIVDVLSSLGFKTENARNVFSSTKVWMQLIYEMKSLLAHHSYQLLDVDTITQRNDDSPTQVTRSNLKYFSFNTNQTIVPSFSELSTTSVNASLQTIGAIQNAFKTLYEDVHFKSDESQISSLSHILSQEFRYSNGLALPEVQRSLVDTFNYTPAPSGNKQVFDSIVGNVPNDIFDIPQQTSALTSISQFKPSQNTAVLTFESKYIDGSDGTITPGSAYFVDSVLSTDGKTFNTSNIDQLGISLSGYAKQLSTIANGMNFFAEQVFDPTDKDKQTFAAVLSNPVDISDYIIDVLVDLQTGNTRPSISADSLGGIYTHAATNVYTKSILFLYAVSRITRTYNETVSFLPQGLFLDNTPLTDSLIDSLLGSLETTVPSSTQPAQFADILLNTSATTSTISVSRETVKSALKTGTPMTTLIENVMIQVLSAFKAGNAAMIGGFTRYSNISDSTVMMATFDLIIKLISMFNNQQLVSTSQGLTLFSKYVTTFIVARIVKNHSDSIQLIRTKLQRETALLQMTVHTTINSMQKVADSMVGFSNYLKSPPAIQKLTNISTIVGDVNILRMLMSEQQIMLLASTLADIKDRLAASPASGNGDVNGDGNVNVDDVFKVLDDSSISSVMCNALFGMMGNNEYASSKGYNKKILSVGIPVGFSQLLKQKISLSKLKKSSFIDKQSDIITISVYKTDLQNGDIVYKPQKFKFELSRFPVRNDNKITTLPENPLISDLVAAFPTRDLGETTSVTNSITYFSTDAQQISFDDESYSFLTNHDKSELAHNHVISYLLEIYTKIICGMDVGEHHFDLVETPRPMSIDIVGKLVEYRAHQVSEALKINSRQIVNDQPSEGGVIFSTTATRSRSGSPDLKQLSNTAGIAGSVSTTSQFKAISDRSSQTKTSSQQSQNGTLEASLSSVSNKSSESMVHDMRVISNIAHVMSPIAEGSNIVKKLLTPKQFDRVFNVCIDPDEFEIDYEKTVSTSQGKLAIQQLISLGDVVSVRENDLLVNLIKNDMSSIPRGYRNFSQNRSATNVHSYKFRDRDKGSGDIAAEKYFVSVETFGEEDV